MVDVGFGAQDCKPSLKPKPVYVGLGALSYFTVLGRGFGLRECRYSVSIQSIKTFSRFACRIVDRTFRQSWCSFRAVSGVIEGMLGKSS